MIRYHSSIWLSQIQDFTSCADVAVAFVNVQTPEFRYKSLRDIAGQHWAEQSELRGPRDVNEPNERLARARWASLRGTESSDLSTQPVNRCFPRARVAQAVGVENSIDAAH